MRCPKSGGKYCVYVNKGWVNVSGFGLFGYRISDPSNNLLYTVFPGNKSNSAAEREWIILFDKNFGDKSMFTAAYVLDKNGLSAYTPNGDITPTTQ